MSPKFLAARLRKDFAGITFRLELDSCGNGYIYCTSNLTLSGALWTTSFHINPYTPYTGIYAEVARRHKDTLPDRLSRDIELQMLEAFDKSILYGETA